MPEVDSLLPLLGVWNQGVVPGATCRVMVAFVVVETMSENTARLEDRNREVLEPGQSSGEDGEGFRAQGMWRWPKRDGS